MNISKKIISVLVVTALLSSMALTACSGASGTPASGTSAAGGEKATSETAAAGGGEYEFSYMMQGKFINWIKENKWPQVLFERTKTKVEFEEGSSDENEYFGAIDQRIIGGSLPDAAQVSVAQATVYGTQGAFVDLAPYIEKFGPNIKAFIEANPDYKQLVTSENGAIYGIVAEAPKFVDWMFWRQDMADKAGISKMPETIDEFTDALRKLKAFYGKDDSNYYPLSGREEYLKNFQNMFDARATYKDGVSKGIYKNGKYGYDVFSPGYKEMVKWLNTLYKEGLIDPEWVAGASTEEAWEAKMLTGKTTMAYDFFTRPAWFMDNGGPKNDPDYNMQVIPFLKDYTGKQSIQTTEDRFQIKRAIVVNIKSEKKTEGVIKLIDYLFSPEGQTLAHWGVEGETYKVEGDKKVHTVDYSKEESTTPGEMRWSFLNDRLTFPKPVDNAAFYTWNNKVVGEAAAKLFNDTYLETAVTVTYTAEQAQKLQSLQATIDEAVVAGVTDFVNGKRDISEWDAFLAEIDAKGYKDLIAVQQEAYDANFKK